MPSIGAGNLRYPTDVVARVLMEETAAFFQKNQGKTSLQLVHFVIFDQKIYNEFQLVYKNMSSPASTIAPSSVSLPSHHIGSNQKKVRASSQSICSFPLPDGLSLELLQGDISNDDSDAIVNTTQENLKLVGGGVSGALLKKGGQALQDACDDAVAKGKTAKEGKVVSTKATGNLKCKDVFHIAFHGGRSLNKTVLSCLELAERKRFSSISFPAIGTGVFNYPASTVSKVIVEALQKFITSKPKHVKVIRIIVFQANVYKDFVTAFNSIGDSSGGLKSYFLRAIKSFLPSFVTGADSNDYEDLNKMETEQIEALNMGEDLGDEEFEVLGDSDNHVAAKFANLSLDSEVTLHIYGEKESMVNRAETKLQATISTTFYTEEIDDASITAFSDETVHELKSFAKDRNVDIEIDQDPDLHLVHLEGFVQDVMLVKDKIRDAMSSISQEESKKAAAASVSKTVCWIRFNPDNEQEEEYGEILNYEIEQAYQKKKKVFDATDDDFMITFDRLEEEDKITKKIAKVKRIDLTKTQGM